MKLYLAGFGRLRQERALARLAKAVCGKIPKLKRAGEINFILISDKEIKRLHKKFLDDPGATDVITFQYPQNRTAAAPHAPFGDIYISVDTARAQAKKDGHELHQEIAFLMVHGLLHLAGHDDHKPRERDKMLSLQFKLIRKIDPKLAPDI